MRLEALVGLGTLVKLGVLVRLGALVRFGLRTGLAPLVRMGLGGETDSGPVIRQTVRGSERNGDLRFQTRIIKFLL